MEYRIVHKTTYDYESMVLHGRHIAHQRIRSTERQSVKKSVLSVNPQPAWRRSGVDYYGNETDELELLRPHDRLEVSVTSLVHVHPPATNYNLLLFQQSWEEVRDRLASDPTCRVVREFCFDSPLVRRHPTLASYASETFTPGRPLHQAIVELNSRIFREFKYEPLATDVSTPLATVMRQRRGVCQDFAHVAVGVLRSLGIAARYVSGYLETRPPPGKPRLVGADASHAWASVFVPDWGWLDFDPTNDVLPSERHIVVGWGRDFSDVSPLKGIVLGGGRHVVSVSVDVAPQSLPTGASPPSSTPATGSPGAASGSGPSQSQQQTNQQDTQRQQQSSLGAAGLSSGLVPPPQPSQPSNPALGSAPFQPPSAPANTAPPLTSTTPAPAAPLPASVTGSFPPREG